MTQTNESLFNDEKPLSTAGLCVLICFEHRLSAVSQTSRNPDCGRGGQDGRYRHNGAASK